MAIWNHPLEKAILTIPGGKAPALDRLILGNAQSVTAFSHDTLSCCLGCVRTPGESSEFYNCHLEYETLALHSKEVHGRLTTGSPSRTSSATRQKTQKALFPIVNHLSVAIENNAETVSCQAEVLHIVSEEKKFRLAMGQKPFKVLDTQKFPRFRLAAILLVVGVKEPRSRSLAPFRLQLKLRELGILLQFTRQPPIAHAAEKNKNMFSQRVVALSARRCMCAFSHLNPSSVRLGPSLLTGSVLWANPSSPFIIKTPSSLARLAAAPPAAITVGSHVQYRYVHVQHRYVLFLSLLLRKTFISSRNSLANRFPPARIQTRHVDDRSERCCVRNPRGTAAQPANLPPPLHLPATDNVVPIGANPDYRRGTIGLVLRLWRRLPRRALPRLAPRVGLDRRRIHVVAAHRQGLDQELLRVPIHVSLPEWLQAFCLGYRNAILQ